MLMAARHPFKAIIGLEFAKRLHEVGEVLHYTPPAGPIVYFLCNSFDHKTLRTVFKSWHKRYQRGEREIRFLYLNMRDIAESAEVLGEQDWLAPVARDRRFVVLAPNR